MEINKVSRIMSINNISYNKPNEAIGRKIKRLDKDSGKTFEEVLKCVIGMKRYK